MHAPSAPRGSSVCNAVTRQCVVCPGDPPLDVPALYSVYLSHTCTTLAANTGLDFTEFPQLTFRNGGELSGTNIKVVAPCPFVQVRGDFVVSSLKIMCSSGIHGITVTGDSTVLGVSDVRCLRLGCNL